MSRAVCAGLAVSNGVTSCFAALLGVVALMGVDVASPTLGRLLLGGAAVCLIAAAWAAALARRGPLASTAGGALAGVVLVVTTSLLFFRAGMASPLQPSTVLALVLVALQVWGVPVVFWLLRRGDRLSAGQERSAAGG